MQQIQIGLELFVLSTSPPKGLSLRDPQSNSKREIARQILQFFLQRPGVADSFDGIARWRLLEQAVDRNVTETEEALRWLIDSGYVTEERIAGSKSLFRLNSKKQSDAQRIVDARDEPDKD
jgi:hypothetical protein